MSRHHADRTEREDRGLPHPGPAHLHVADDLALVLGHEREGADFIADGFRDRGLEGPPERRPLDLDGGISV